MTSRSGGFGGPDFYPTTTSKTRSPPWRSVAKSMGFVYPREKMRSPRPGIRVKPNSSYVSKLTSSPGSGDGSIEADRECLGGSMELILGKEVDISAGGAPGSGIGM